MAVILGNVAYFAEHAVGSRSTSQALQRIGGIRGGGHHCRPRDLVLPEDTVTFRTIRNHYDALVSQYLKITAKARPEFKDFLIKAGTRPYTWAWAPDMLWGRQRHVDVTLKYENLETELNALLKEHDLLPEGEPIELPTIGAIAEKGNYRDYYDAESKALVKKYFGDEMEEYGYDWVD